MNVGSCFSGIGGMDLGLARAGMRHAFLCEADPYRRRVLKRHWPGLPVYEDVRVVGRDDGSPARGRDRDDSDWDDSGRADSGIDLLCGGFPCQDLSVAGKRKGLAGDRSGLFFEFARVADSLLRPGGWLLIENVPGLLSSHGGRDFAVLLASLGELGFHDLSWRVLDSRYFGVPQRRRRVFILARRSRGRRASEVLLEPESGGGDFAPSREAGQGVATRVEDGAARTLKADGGTSIKGEDHDTYIPIGFHATQDPISERDSTPALGRNSYLGVSTPPHPNGVRAPSGATGRMDAYSMRLAQTSSNGWGIREGETGTLDETGGPAIYAEGTASDRCAVDPKPDGPRYAGCGDAVTATVAEWIGRRLMEDEA